MDYPKLFEPITLNKLTLKNRVVLPAHGARVGPQAQIRYLEERVKHGLGLVLISTPAAQTVGSYTVTPPGPSDPEGDGSLPNPLRPGASKVLDDALLPVMRAQVAMAHRHGAACFGQIHHTGTYNAGANFQPGLSPSGMPDEMLGEMPHELMEEEIKEIVQVYGQAADRVKRAGMDGVELHCVHGLLTNSFLSPLTNKRTDKYGGSLENRVRFVREILAEIRRVLGPDLVLGIRMPTDEFLVGGLTNKDLIDIALIIKPYLDYINVSGASEHGRKGGVTIPAVPSMDHPPGVYQDPASAMRKAVGLPLLLTGRITDPAQAEKLLADGKADMVGMVRAHIADPQWVKKVLAGEADDIRRCTGDNECRRRTQARGVGGGVTLGCTQNAAIGRESEVEMHPAPRPKRVLVIGGGPAGMEAARVAALRGHQVILCEKEAQLGGQIIPVVTKDPRQRNLARSVEYLSRQMSKLKVDVRLRTELDAAAVRQIAPDAVIVATGSVPNIPSIPGVNSSKVATISQVLRGDVQAGKRVCVVTAFNGYKEPGSLAEMLADQGRQVEIITERMFVGESQDPGTNHNQLKRLKEKGVAMHPLTGLKAVSDGEITVFDCLTRKERTMTGFDTVVLAGQGKSNDTLYRALRGQTKELYAAGDCLAPRRVMNAVLEGYRAGLAV